MRTIHVRPKAQADVDEIWTYTASEWDTDQADEYIQTIRTGLRRVALHPMLGTDASLLAPHLRRIRSGSHLIYYLHSHEMIDAVRILHQRMDPAAHL